VHFGVHRCTTTRLADGAGNRRRGGGGRNMERHDSTWRVGACDRCRCTLLRRFEPSTGRGPKSSALWRFDIDSVQLRRHVRTVYGLFSPEAIFGPRSRGVRRR
jgi:hypothetical protein